MYFVLTSDHKLSDEVFTVRRTVDTMFCQNCPSKLSVNYQFTVNGVVYVDWIIGVCLKDNCLLHQYFVFISIKDIQNKWFVFQCENKHFVEI